MGPTAYTEAVLACLRDDLVEDVDEADFRLIFQDKVVDELDLRATEEHGATPREYARDARLQTERQVPKRSSFCPFEIAFAAVVYVLWASFYSSQSQWLSIIVGAHSVSFPRARIMLIGKAQSQIYPRLQDGEVGVEHDFSILLKIFPIFIKRPVYYRSLWLKPGLDPVTEDINLLRRLCITTFILNRGKRVVCCAVILIFPASRRGKSLLRIPKLFVF